MTRKKTTCRVRKIRQETEKSMPLPELLPNYVSFELYSRQNLRNMLAAYRENFETLNHRELMAFSELWNK